MIFIVDYETGNSGSIFNILRRLGYQAKITNNREEILSDFTKKSGNGILMSTYANQSYDNQNIHFVIIVKLPFLSLGDTKVKLKMKDSELWYQTYTVRM